MDDVEPRSTELAARWTSLHHGIAPDSVRLLPTWLRLMWAGGRVLARAGVPPTAVTVAGVVAAGGAVRLASSHPVAAGGAVVAAALCDGLDGATAVVANRATASGARADAVADRLCDAAFAAVLWHRGAPAWVAGIAVGAAGGVDTLRRLRGTPERITVAERPTFTVCTVAACAVAPVIPHRWPARVSAAVWVGAGGIGILQLLRIPARPRSQSV